VRIDRAATVADVRRIARRRLPRPVFDLVDGAAGEELTMRRNEAAFSEIRFRPRAFADVAGRDLRTSVLGQPVSMPVLLAPTGAGRLIHRMAELTVARAARQAGTIYVQSTITSFAPEDVVAAAGGPIWYQLYLPATPGQTREVLRRIRDAGYSAVAVTIDNAVIGKRERDLRNRVTMPPRITPQLALRGATRPGWAASFARASLLSRGAARRGPLAARAAAATGQQIMVAPRAVTWDDLKMVRDAWDGPLIVKGLMRPDECPRLTGLGVQGAVVSNHGGRQLDGVPASVEVLPSIVAELASHMEVYLDGGVRRGADVVKALALGARAVFIGRPYLYGLAASASAGVPRVLAILRAEIDLTMALLGCRTVADIDPSVVQLPRAWSPPGD
jgi:isopentenyl diphosphate isomerase/L-lactate dehydrogenase-like FMN-dependent dehydrogenase